jgi:hypothetical protein
MITDTLLIDALNKEMHDRYRVLDGRPIYRLVWSDDQLEIRRGLTRDYYGHIFIREYFSVGPRKKYWYFKNPCWILEKLTFIQGQQALKEVIAELVEANNGTYEPVFPFVDKDFNPLPVSALVLDIVLWKLHNPTTPLTPSQLDDLRMKIEAEEVKYFEEELGKGERSPLFVFGSSAFVSSNQQGFAKTYKPEYIEK